MGIKNPFQEVDVTVNAGLKEPAEDVFSLTSLERDERSGVEDYLRAQAGKLKKASPTVASQFSKEIPNMIDLVRYMKQATDEKSLSSEHPQIPPTRGIGVNLIHPKDIYIEGVQQDHFELNLTEGNEFYLWGGPTDTDYYTPTDPDDGDGYAIYLIKNGIIHEGETPVTRQFQFTSENVTNNPYGTNPLDDISLEVDRPITAYELNGSHVLSPEIGTNLRGVATRDVSNLEYEMIGIVVYEESYYQNLYTW